MGQPGEALCLAVHQWLCLVLRGSSSNRANRNGATQGPYSYARGGVHTADCLCQSCRPYGGAHVTPLIRNCDTHGSGRLALAYTAAIVDRESASCCDRRLRGSRCGLPGIARASIAFTERLFAGGFRSAG